MDVTDNVDGALDPRIQIELENLNDATDDINKLETELDEAHTAFRQLLSETTKRLKEILNKVGNSCVEKARCYYEALEVARQAQIKCQQQAQLFQRASEIHVAAKETVALAESRFMSHQHEWNFDQAWQDMLNHATLKVMDAENQKAECGREHYRRAVLFHNAEKRLLQLEEKHRRSIIKARPYFEVKAQCDQMLATQKERVECLQKAIQDAKTNYATSLRRLEEISNQIHQQRRDYDFIANGPREPGVGAELVSPQKNSNYDVEFNQLSCSKIKDFMNNQLKKYNRIQDYDNDYQLQEDTENLGKRSVDGSEAISSQWEFELGANIENLNNLSVKNSVLDHDSKNENPGCILCYTQCQQSSMNLLQESNISLNSTYTHMKKMQISQQESDYYSKHHQRLRQCDPINIEQLYTKSWNQNYSHMLQNFDRNTLTYYHNDFEDTSDYEQVRNQNNMSGERSRNCDKEKQRQSYCNLFKRRNVESYMLEAKVNGQITAECSRRPIRCPRIDCAINVAFSALTHHFIFDHPEVPILNIEPGIKSTLIVSFSALSSNTSRCLALLLVSGKLSEPIAKLFNGSQINPKYRNRLPLSVLAARLHCTDQYISNEKINKKKDFHEKNIIIAWVAGLDIGNTTDKLLCSIQAVDKIDNEGLRCLTYTGPVNSLRTAQCPQDIYSTGDCIVLHEGLLSHITSDCATLNVNVTVH